MEEIETHKNGLTGNPIRVYGNHHFMYNTYISSFFLVGVDNV